jgi:alanine racemase
MLTCPRALIDHAALAHNLAVVRRHAPRSRVWAVVKSDAYGHGMRQAAASLAGADGFAVARVEEGIALREAGVAAPILVLAGAMQAEEVELAGRLGLELSLHQEGQLALLEHARPVRPLRIWVKVDTGMHRLGLDPEAVPRVLERLAACPGVAPGPGLMTHLANADDPADPFSERQCERLRALAVPGQMLSIGNSGGLLAFPAARTDWVRPGIMLYGASPFTGRSAAELDLRPVMTLHTSLISLRHLRRGDRVGYGGTYTCPEDMPVGVAAIGYGDGYPRHAAQGTPVLVRGRRAPLVGRVSMDSITVDLRGVSGAAVGDEITLWGRGLPAEEIAERAGTISYALFCGVTARVKRVYASMGGAPQGEE